MDEDGPTAADLRVRDYQAKTNPIRAEPFHVWWKAMILVAAFLALAAIALAVTLFTMDIGSSGGTDAAQVKCDPNQFPGATFITSDGTNQWLTFTPTKSTYRNVNGLVAWTIEFTFVPRVAADFDSTYILMNFKLPVKLAQPAGASPFPAPTTVITSSGLAVFQTNITWRPFVEPSALLDESSVKVRFARWDDGFRSSDNNSYVYAPTNVTQSATGTGSMVLYYMGGNKI